MKKISIIFLGVALLILSCENKKTEVDPANHSITKSLYGHSGEKPVHEYTLTNPSGASVSVITFGGIVTSIKVPDRAGNLGEVVLGFDSLGQYEQRSSFGAMVGRFANRIANARFELDGIEYKLEANNGPNNLHSGPKSFKTEVWEVVEEINEEDTSGLILKLITPHMYDGFPGELTSYVTYQWTSDNALIIDYKATTDRKTILNFTNHSYFNLGDNGESILDHELKLFASQFLPINEFSIPTGERRAVKNTPFDFTNQKPVGRDIEAAYDQLDLTKGYDHCWVIDNWDRELKKIAELYEPTKGRVMNTYTTEPGVQVYTANGLKGMGKGGVPFVNHGAICLETQHFPDSPNQPDFPTTILEAGKTYLSKTIYQFSVR
ncbi:MAG: galactose mutarotase [Cyclobacteriaceae bacterium]|nr:galactose mutarotase [Cyclobacteriaceae bacterium SS2]